MDNRASRRREALERAEGVVASLNEAVADPRPLLRLPDGKRPLHYFLVDLADRRADRGVFNPVTKKWHKRVYTSRRPYGRVTIWFEGSAFRVKVTRNKFRMGELELSNIFDTFLHLDDLVARCRCNRFFVRRDARQKYCTPACENKVGQARRRAHAKLSPEARASVHAAEGLAKERSDRLRARKALVKGDRREYAERQDKRAREEQGRKLRVESLEEWEKGPKSSTEMTDFVLGVSDHLKPADVVEAERKAEDARVDQEYREARGLPEPETKAERLARMRAAAAELRRDPDLRRRLNRPIGA